MQVLSSLRFKAETKEEMILQVLLDKHCRGILNATKGSPITAFVISENCGIPLSTVYRRLKILRELRFLHVSCTIRSDGKKLLSFQNRIAGIDISWDDGYLQIHPHLSSSMRYDPTL